MKKNPTVAEHMSPVVHSIGQDQTLDIAHEMMRKWAIRHLPVLEGGKIVGLLSLRDLHLIETLPDVDPAAVMVEDAMTQEPYTTQPNTPLRDVAAEMAEKKLGSAIVVRDGKVVGVFTTVDALEALVDLLDRQSA